MKPLKVRISITLDDPIYQRIKGLAEYDDRSVSSYINLALRDHLNQLDREAREWEKRRE
jgi:predicted transcriptional regulator